MSKARKERLRKLLIKKNLLSDIRRMEKFLRGRKSLNEYISEKISQYGDMPAVTDEYNHVSMTYKEFSENVRNLAAKLQNAGVKRGDFVSIFTENNGYWALCDQAVMQCGGVCTLRGSNAPATELDYIINHSSSVGLILKDGKLLNAIKSCLEKYELKFIVIMFKGKKDDFSGINIPVYYLEDAIEEGKTLEFKAPEQTLDDNCSMLYTSGTTGNPKGVLLTHKNMLSQMPTFETMYCSQKGEKTLHILPVWHSYEQTAQLYQYSAGCHLHYTTLAGLKNDLIKYQPASLMTVPRLWEAIRLGIFQKLKQNSHFTYRLFDYALKVSIEYKIHKMYSERRVTNNKDGYNNFVDYYHNLARVFLKPIHVIFTNTLYKKIKTNFGLNFRAALSGGGSLSMKDQLFYDAIGVNLREAYGLTETSPLLTIRNVNELNFLGCCGKPAIATEIKIADIETGEELGTFKKGIVHARGYQIMKGYYKDDFATGKAVNEEGWFNTGDIGWLTSDNNLVLVGRMKETIVLSNGENVEPIPIEEACLGSPYIEQIMIVGQDKSSLGALVIPSEAALQKCGILAKDLKSGTTLSIKDQTLRDLIKRELATYIKNKQNLKPFEQIKQFEVLKENFSTANGLMSQTSKMKRNSIFEKYKTTINNMFEKNK